jgi:hypothetical protein
MSVGHRTIHDRDLAVPDKLEVDRAVEPER